MEKIIEFNARQEKKDVEKIRDRYKKDFEDFMRKRAEAEKIVFLEVRKEM